MKQQPYSYRADKAVPPFADDKPIIIFDGYCVMCSHWENFVLRNDKHALRIKREKPNPCAYTPLLGMLQTVIYADHGGS